MNFKQIGTATVARGPRIYQLDPLNDWSDGNNCNSVIVLPETKHPIYSNGFTTIIVFSGFLNIGRWFHMGDGAFSLTDEDIAGEILVSAPSKSFGPDEWKEMLADPTWTEGHPEQRIQINIFREKI